MDISLPIKIPGPLNEFKEVIDENARCCHCYWQDKSETEGDRNKAEGKINFSDITTVEVSGEELQSGKTELLLSFPISDPDVDDILEEWTFGICVILNGLRKRWEHVSFEGKITSPEYRTVTLQRHWREVENGINDLINELEPPEVALKSWKRNQPDIFAPRLLEKPIVLEELARQERNVEDKYISFGHPDSVEFCVKLEPNNGMTQILIWWVITEGQTELGNETERIQTAKNYLGKLVEKIQNDIADIAITSHPWDDPPIHRDFETDEQFVIAVKNHLRSWRDKFGDKWETSHGFPNGTLKKLHKATQFPLSYDQFRKKIKLKNL